MPLSITRPAAVFRYTAWRSGNVAHKAEYVVQNPASFPPDRQVIDTDGRLWVPDGDPSQRPDGWWVLRLVPGPNDGWGDGELRSVEAPPGSPPSPPPGFGGTAEEWAVLGPMAKAASERLGWKWRSFDRGEPVPRLEVHCPLGHWELAYGARDAATFEPISSGWQDRDEGIAKNQDEILAVFHGLFLLHQAIEARRPLTATDVARRNEAASSGAGSDASATIRQAGADFLSQSAQAFKERGKA